MLVPQQQASIPHSNFDLLDSTAREYILDPVKFAEKFLGVTLWSKQVDILRSIATKRKVAVKACHSSSKTFTAAIITLWWLARYKNSIVVTTAPTQKQVDNLLWKEIRVLLAQSKYPFPQPPPKASELYFPNQKRYALGFTTSVENGDGGVKLQGFHAEHLLLIFDEAPGVDGVLWGAVEGILSSGDAKLLALGNPVISSGPFYDAFGINRATWDTHSISSFDTPNLKGVSISQLLKMSDDELSYNPVPYLTSRHWVKDRYLEWGDQSPLFVSRVMGNFPAQSADSLLSIEWLERARNKELSTYSTKNRKLSAGLDVAGPGEDETVLVIREQENIILTKAWPQADPRGEVVRELLPYKDIIEVNVDTAGIGYYIARHLEDNGFLVSDVNVGSATHDREKYANLKAELYWALRMRLSAGEMAGLTDELAISQLAGIRYKTNARGQIEIESKDAAAKRGVKSPDRAEAIMLAFSPSFQHGLFGFWEESYEESMERVKLNPATDSESLSDAQKHDAGFTDKYNEALYNGPKSEETMHGVAEVKTMGKVMTATTVPVSCPTCGNKFLSVYGEAWRCGGCGDSSKNHS